MKQFETGMTYGMSVCRDCIHLYTVVKRTAHTVTLADQQTDEVKTFRINAKGAEMFGEQFVYPFGRYSLCPVLSASKAV